MDNTNIVGNSWDEILMSEYQAEYFQQLRYFLRDEYKAQTIYPAKENIFNALKYVSPEQVRVVILGQDPYINPNQAHGFAFSVMPGVTPPPSLKNMYRELSDDLGVPTPKDGCLLKWANQGVLLLNTVLTVRAGASNSHAKHGWEQFTDAVIRYLGSQQRPIVFILWGRPAQNKAGFITNPAHCVIKAPHPSPLSAGSGFFGSKPYSKTNEFLRSAGLEPVDWAL